MSVTVISFHALAEGKGRAIFKGWVGATSRPQANDLLCRGKLWLQESTPEQLKGEGEGYKVAGSEMKEFHLKAFVGVTDFEWFTYLSSLPGIDEVNFWQPGGKQRFRTLSPGEPFLFKLHSPRDYIVGGGFFAHSTILPVSLAWDAFGEKNGASSLEEMRSTY